MTHGDIEFLKAVGIDPPGFGEPSSDPLSPPSPAGMPFPMLTAEDARWLLILGVTWGHGVEPEFIPPKTLQEYLTRYPTGIREAVGEVADELGIALPDNGLDDLSQEITRMFLGFLDADLEDAVAMYVTFRPIRPREDRSEHFHSYVKMRLRAALPVVLGNMGADGR